MSLENEDGMQWFKAGWRRGDRKFTPADAAERNFERTTQDLVELRRAPASNAMDDDEFRRALDVALDRVFHEMPPLSGRGGHWDADAHVPQWNSPCTPPDAPGVYQVAARAEFDPEENHTIAIVRLAHWNGLRWSKSFPVQKGAPGTAPARQFSSRQDYPWREVGA